MTKTAVDNWLKGSQSKFIWASGFLRCRTCSTALEHGLHGMPNQGSQPMLAQAKRFGARGTTTDPPQ